MNQSKVKFKSSGISATMLFPLWGRAILSKEHSSLFYDAKAIELVERIDYDFSTSDMPFESIMFNFSRKSNLFSLIALLAKQSDDKIKAYIAQHPRASVVNIGAGLDATFYRVDNGLIQWYDLDLPAVIEVRKQLLPEPDRVTYIAKSLLDPSWCKDIKHTEGGVFIIATGVLPFFGESEVKQFFSMLADNFHGGEIVFNALLELESVFGAWFGMFPPDQRDAMRAALMDALKEWWEKAPHDQRDKLNNMIATLKTPTKPRGKEWADLEAWCNQLSDKEMEEAMRDLMASSDRYFGRWTLKDADEMTKWDNRITVIDRFPWYRNIPRDSFSAAMRGIMDYSDKSGRFYIIHLQV